MTLPQTMTEVPHTTFAVIKISRENINTMLATVSNSPAGKERLIDIMWRYPYRPGVVYYFVGGNYLKQQGPVDYTRHILTQDELDLLFTYDMPKARQGQRNPDINWFAAQLKDQEIDEVMG